MLQASELELERGGRRLFRGLSLALGAGELLRVAGANGSGKTTLLKILCGLLAPEAGEVRWQGTPIRLLREEFSRHLVYYDSHIAKEEEDVIARAARALGPEDWAAVKNAVPSVKDPLFGEVPEERYRKLRRQIALEA